MGKVIYADINAINEPVKRLEAQIQSYLDHGADGCYIYDRSENADVREQFFGKIRSIRETVDFRMRLLIAAARFEDVKKAYYTGAEVVYLPFKTDDAVIRESIERFGADHIGLELDISKNECDKEATERLHALGIRRVMLKHVEDSEAFFARIARSEFDIMIRDSLRRHGLSDLISRSGVAGIATDFYAGKDICRIKNMLIEEGIEMEMRVSAVPFSAFKENESGLVPVVVQEVETGEVLMLAYMNEESYNRTISTGKMTYYSRSRQELWVKGETSGHYQYVKSLAIDCDQDTILAKVHQIGAACHTGNHSCFFTPLIPDEGAAAASENGSLDILEEVYRTIADRKLNPKEGSYTNYLFDKGIDKILKKCGEESAEIIIAAKNPDRMELRYEIADYLYHLMVLMVDSGLSWADVMKELADRH